MLLLIFFNALDHPQLGAVGTVVFGQFLLPCLNRFLRDD